MVQGGDLHEALMDNHSGAQGAGLLSWHRQGAKVALDIAKGLESLHVRKVSNVTYAYTDAHTKSHILDIAKGLESLHAWKVSTVTCIYRETYTHPYMFECRTSN